MTRTQFGLLCASGWLWVCLAVGGAGNCSAQVSDHLLPTNTELARVALERAWWSQATINPARSVVRHLVVDEDVLLVQTSGGVVTAFDSETGRKLWARQLGQRDDPQYRATSNRDFVFIVSGINLYCLGKFDGKIAWWLRLPRDPSTSPTVDDRQIYFGTVDGSVFAYDLRELDKLFDQGRLPEFAVSALRWRFKTGGEILSAPISTGRVVNFASKDASLYSVGTALGRLQWQFETDAPASAPLAEHAEYIVMPTADFNVYCIKKETGALEWRPFVLGYPVRVQPQIIDEHIYLIALEGGLYCLSLRKGERLWSYPRITGFVAATDQFVYVTDVVGNLVVLHRQNGALRGALPLRRFSVRLANNRTDRIYLCTPDGLVLCLREVGREFPWFHLHPERMPILPELAPAQTAQSQSGSTTQ